MFLSCFSPTTSSLVSVIIICLFFHFSPFCLFYIHSFLYFSVLLLSLYLLNLPSPLYVFISLLHMSLLQPCPVSLRLKSEQQIRYALNWSPGYSSKATSLGQLNKDHGFTLVTHFPCNYNTKCRPYVRHIAWRCVSAVCQFVVCCSNTNAASAARANVYLAHTCELLIIIFQYINASPTWHHVGKLSLFIIYLPIRYMIWDSVR
jgi:hypothetical protein